MKQALENRTKIHLFQGGAFAILGVILSSLGYASSSAPVNLDEIVGPVLFWYAVVMLLLAFPLREAAAACNRGLRTRLGAAVFWPYLLVHLLLYGFLVEVILGSIYGLTSTLSPSIVVSTDTFMPASALSTLLNLAYNPSVAFALPPALSGELTAYAVSIAVLVDVLLLANVVTTVELGRLCTLGGKARSYFLMPMVGLVLGASCCLSIPALISITSPSANASSAFIGLYTDAYYLFPPFAVVVLFLNFWSVVKITNRVKPPPSQPGEKIATP
jgi:hypothetical protein